MSSVVEILRYQLDFSSWAAERILAAATALTPEEQSRDFKTADKFWSTIEQLLFSSCSYAIVAHSVDAGDKKLKDKYY